MVNNSKFIINSQQIMDLSERAQPLAEEELATEIYDLVADCASNKQIKKGANEVTKTLNRSITSLIIIAADANPLEIVLHLPLLSEEKNIPYVFVPSKKALGKHCGTTRNVIAVSILKNERSKLNDNINAIVDKCERLFTSSE